VERTGRRAAIGALAEIEQIVDATAGTSVIAGPHHTAREEMP
jgi:hypothetical protein